MPSRGDTQGKAQTAGVESADAAVSPVASSPGSRTSPLPTRRDLHQTEVTGQHSLPTPISKHSAPDAESNLDDPERMKRSQMGAVTDLDETFKAFADPHQEWRRLLAEVVGTFFLTLVAAGAPMMGIAVAGSVSRVTAVVAPGMMVMAVIMSFGKISGAHLNPSVSIAFALRGDFPWKRVPGYWVAQLLGASIAGYILQWMLKTSASGGATYPANGYGPVAAFFMEFILTFGLVTVILGTASGAQNIGLLGSIGVGSYIALAGMWGSPVSGASMNPARSFGPSLASLDFTSYWVYVAGPVAGALLAVLIGYLLRGPGGGWIGSAAGQGSIDVQVQDRQRP